MNREELYESMSGIDDDLLERSEQAAASRKKVWKVLLPLAACFCVLILSAALLGQDYFTVEPTVPTESTAPPTEPTQPPAESTQPSTETEPTRETVPPISPDSWEVVYNDYTDGIDALIAAPFGYFSEEMSQEQIKLLLPDALLERTDIEGRAYYKAGNEVWYARIWMQVDDYAVGVFYKYYPTCILENPKGITSVCGDVEYLVMEETWEKKITKEKYVETETPGVYWVEKEETGEVELIIERLRAEATINGVPMFFFMDVESKTAEEEKKIFKEILTAFATYPEGMPAIDKLTPLEPRNDFKGEITLEEARKDEILGSYLPQQIPENLKILSLELFREESTQTEEMTLKLLDGNNARYKWMISVDSQAEVDADISQLSLELVQKCMKEQDCINVRYGEIMVSVHYPRGYRADSQWIYEQLIALAE